ncbi:hypothetical protein CsSME_00035623 [Camellia sinensis var. sinensis]
MTEDEVQQPPRQQGSSNGGAAHTEDHDPNVVIEAVQSLQDTQKEILAALQTLTKAIMAMPSRPALVQAPLPIAFPNPVPNLFSEVRALVQVPLVVHQANSTVAGSAT